MKNTIIFDNKIDFKQGETLTFFLNENLDFRAESRIFSAQTLNKIQVYLKNLKSKKTNSGKTLGSQTKLFLSDVESRGKRQRGECCQGPHPHLPKWKVCRQSSRA